MRVVVAMSGGVDSSVAAALAAGSGSEAVGVTLRHMKHPGASPGADFCGSDANIEDAKRVCRKLGIEHHVLDSSEAFEASVAGPFVDAYLGGRTPNPCVECNSSVKFGMLLEWIAGRDARLVTGHYVRADSGGGRFRLLMGSDKSKDQSYFLYRLTQDQLSRALFPLGALTKGEVRAKARALGLPTAGKDESQDVCFLPDRDYRAFVRERAPGTEGAPFAAGDIRDGSGRLLGRHRGLVEYTVGQRKGLGVSASKPLYVTRVDLENNTLVVGPEREILKSRFTVTRLTWIRGRAPEGESSLGVRVRHRAPIVPGVCRVLARAPEAPSGAGADRAEVEMSRDQRAVAPGQSAVFYDGEEVLGGGIIEEVL